MGITRILLKWGVTRRGKGYDVLIPLPANADACLAKIGITDFEDADDSWDADFLRLLEVLFGKGACSIAWVDPATAETEPAHSAGLADIQGMLAACDHMNVTISSDDRHVTFTRGHLILWLQGFSHSTLESLPFSVEATENDRIGDLF
jgi:hypothetical protein